MNLTIDKDEFYSTLSGQDIQDINKLIVELEQQEPSTINNAYRGALLTKKAAFEVNAVKKINTFKTGLGILFFTTRLKHSSNRYKSFISWLSSLPNIL